MKNSTRSLKNCIGVSTDNIGKKGKQAIKNKYRYTLESDNDLMNEKVTYFRAENRKIDRNN